MSFNKVFNQEEIARLKKLVQEGDQVLHEVDALNTGLRETVKAIAEEMQIKPAVLKKAIKVAHKGNFQENADDYGSLENILATTGKIGSAGTP